MGPHKSRAEGDDHLPVPAGHPSADGAQDPICFPSCRSALLAHVQLFIHREPQVLLCRAALKDCSYQSVRMPGIPPAQVESLELCRVGRSELGAKQQALYSLFCLPGAPRSQLYRELSARHAGPASLPTHRLEQCELVAGQLASLYVVQYFSLVPYLLYICLSSTTLICMNTAISSTAARTAPCAPNNTPEALPCCNTSQARLRTLSRLLPCPALPFLPPSLPSHSSLPPSLPARLSLRCPFPVISTFCPLPTVSREAGSAATAGACVASSP